MNSIELTRKQITAIADEYSFTATNVEKVIRLCGILDDLSTIDSFKGKLALKGGTAINLVLIPDLPRLSVDLDLDLAIDCSKDEMLLLRKQLEFSCFYHGEINSFYSEPLSFSLRSILFSVSKNR